MDVKIWPRTENDRGGYACMPLKENVPEGHADWKPVHCQECERECWETPLVEVVKQQNTIALCTECALRKGIR